MDGVFLREDATGKAARIGRYDPSLPGPENRMTPCPDGFTALGLPALERCIQTDSPWVYLDEIGYLEASVPAYQAALLRLMERKRLMAVVRKQDLPFLRALTTRQDVFLVDLDDPFGNLGCVIMASGLGKRFGGNKLMADFHGRPMICRALEATEGIFSRRVVVTRHPQVADLCRTQGVDAILHDLPRRSDTVRLGLEALGDGITGCLFCPGDQPLLSRDSVTALALSGNNDRNAIWRTAWEATFGTPVLFPRWIFPELLTLPEGKGGNVLTKKYPEQVRQVPVRDKYELMDVDTREDLDILLER